MKNDECDAMMSREFESGMTRTRAIDAIDARRSSIVIHSGLRRRENGERAWRKGMRSGEGGVIWDDE